ncbi:MAG: MFS transporter [Burkholderiales bacterium]
MTNNSSAAPLPNTGKPVRFAALHQREFRIYLIASALAMMGDNIEHVISYWVLYERFQSPALGGFAILSHWLPFLFFSVYFGALADRFDPRRIMQIAMLMFMGVSLAWGLLLLTDTLELWHAAVLLMIHGMAGVLWGPGSQLLIHHLVEHEHLQSAIRLNSTSRTLGLLFGPAVGGGLMLVLSPAIGLLVNALVYVPLLFWLWKAPYTPPRREAQPARAVGMRETLSQLKNYPHSKTVFSMILLAGATSFFVGSGIQPQMPEFAHDLGAGDADMRYNMLLAAGAAGAIIGSLILESRGLLPANPRSAIVLAILWCLVMAGFAVSTNYLLSLALMLIAGFLNLAYGAMAQTLVQVHAPPELRGRLIGLYNLSANGLRAFSGITIGVLGGLIGIHWSLALSSMVLLAVCIALLAFAMRTR